MMDKIDVKEAYKERKAPGSTAYPEVKADGDQSMPTESGSCPKAFTVESSRETRTTRQEPHFSNLSLQR
jgi:hypothetical protein